jgi:hypothetical protein
MDRFYLDLDRLVSRCFVNLGLHIYEDWTGLGRIHQGKYSSACRKDAADIGLEQRILYTFVYNLTLYNFILCNSGHYYRQIDGLGLFREPVYDNDHTNLGCIRYESRFSFDRGFKTSRFMAILTMILLTLMLILITSCYLFVKNRGMRKVFFWTVRFLVFPTLFFNCLMFIFYGREVCKCKLCLFDALRNDDCPYSHTSMFLLTTCCCRQRARNALRTWFFGLCRHD